MFANFSIADKLDLCYYVLFEILKKPETYDKNEIFGGFLFSAFFNAFPDFSRKLCQLFVAYKTGEYPNPTSVEFCKASLKSTFGFLTERHRSLIKLIKYNIENQPKEQNKKKFADFFNTFFLQRVIQSNLEIYIHDIPNKYRLGIGNQYDITTLICDFIDEIKEEISGILDSILENTDFLHITPKLREITQEYYFLSHFSAEDIQQVTGEVPDKGFTISQNGFFQIYIEDLKNDFIIQEIRNDEKNGYVVPFKEETQSTETQSTEMQSTETQNTETQSTETQSTDAQHSEETSENDFFNKYKSGFIHAEIAQLSKKQPMELSSYRKFYLLGKFNGLSSNERIEAMKIANRTNDDETFTFFHNESVHKYETIAETYKSQLSNRISSTYFAYLTASYKHKFEIQIRKSILLLMNEFQPDDQNGDVCATFNTIINHFLQKHKYFTNDQLYPFLILSAASKCATLIKTKLNECTTLDDDSIQNISEYDSNIELNELQKQVMRKLFICSGNIAMDDLYEDQILLIVYIIQQIKIIIAQQNELIENYFISILKPSTNLMNTNNILEQSNPNEVVYVRA